MKFLKFLLVLAVIVGGGLYFYGSRLPREHKVTSTIVLVAPADTVFKAIRNNGTTPTWWSDMKSARRLSGMRRETWEENMGPAGILNIEVTKVVPNRQIVHTILDQDGKQGWGGKWTIDIYDSSSGTEVTITEEGYVDNPIMRVAMNMLGGYYRTIDSYLRSLGAHYGEVVNPQRG